MSMPAVSKHLRVLERAGLIARGRRRSGGRAGSRRRRLKEVADWTEHYRHIWEERLDRLDSTCNNESEGEEVMVVSSAVNSDSFEVTTPSDRKSG